MVYKSFDMKDLIDGGIQFCDNTYVVLQFLVLVFSTEMCAFYSTQMESLVLKI